MKRSLLYLLLFLAIQLTVGFGTPLLLHTTQAVQTLVAVAVSNVLTLVVFLALRWCPASRAYLRSRPWTTLAWTATLAVGIVIPLTWLEELLPDALTFNIVGQQMAAVLRQPYGYFVLCLVAPLAEEVVFRGAMLTALRDNRYAILISALFFAAVHMNPAQMPHALLVGLLLGWLYMRTGSIVPGLLVHWVNNTAAYVALGMFPMLPSDARLIDYFGTQAAVAQAVVCSLLIALPAGYQLWRRLSAFRQ